MKKITALLLILIVIVIASLYISCGKTREKKGVILIVLDALRRDHLSYYGYKRPTSPFLDDLIRNSLLFSNAISAAPQTVPSVSSLLTGIYPYRHGSHFFSMPQSYHPTKPVAHGGLPLIKPENLLLAECLAEENYRTAGVSCNPGIRNIYGFGQGLEYFRYFDCFSESGAGVCDGTSVNRIFEKNVLPLIKDENFFVYLHYMDVHNPYHKPNSFKGRFAKYQGEPYYINGKAPSLATGQLEYSIACYDECIIHLDGVLKELFGILTGKGLDKRTLVVITSDHGDEFFEHGGLGHGTTCYDELVSSFILFVNPALPKRDIREPVSLVDVFPTVLEWSDIKSRTDLDGVSLMPYFKPSGLKSAYKAGKRIFLSELGDRKAVIDGNMKFIYNLVTKTSELYDMKKDPNEITNIAGKKPALAAHYLEIIKKVVKKMTISYSERTLSANERRTLESLGYIK